MTSALLLALVGSVATLELRVEGEGYLRFASDGRIVYARSASLAIRDGRLVTSTGASLMPMISPTKGATSFGAEKDGRLFAVIGRERKEIGRITFAMFGANEALASSGSFLIAKSRPRLEYPGENGAGTLFALKTIETIQIIAPNNSNPSTPSFVDLTIPAAVELDGGRMTLDRIVSSAPESIKSKLQTADFGPIPAPGFPTKITRSRVLAKLLLAGFRDSELKLNMTETVEVSAAGQRIEPKQFIEAALAGISAKLGVSMELKVEGEPIGFTVSKGELELKTENVTQRENQIQVSVAIYVDGKRINSKILNFSGDQAAIAIKAGELVKVVMRANGVAIETTGRAKRAARIGQSVEVEIAIDSNSKTTHLGVVKAAGMVEVKI